MVVTDLCFKIENFFIQELELYFCLSRFNLSMERPAQKYFVSFRSGKKDGRQTNRFVENESVFE